MRLGHETNMTDWKRQTRAYLHDHRLESRVYAVECNAGQPPNPQLQHVRRRPQPAHKFEPTAEMKP